MPSAQEPGARPVASQHSTVGSQHWITITIGSQRGITALYRWITALDHHHHWITGWHHSTLLLDHNVGSPSTIGSQRGITALHRWITALDHHHHWIRALDHHQPLDHSVASQRCITAPRRALGVIHVPPRGLTSG
eukprot:5618075-Pyramimonas_sp.AAC.1